MRILILGGAGMLGHKLVQRLSADTADLWWTLRGQAAVPQLGPVPLLSGDHAIENVDAANTAVVESTIRELRPDSVVNCIGVVKQRHGAMVIPSIYVNALLPHCVANTLATYGGRLIHVSTDCVFSGRRGQYSENDEPDPIDLYGRTKALGEVVADNAVTLRTSMIGRELRHHRGLLDWFLSRSQRVPGYRKAFWSGVTTTHLAELIRTILYEHRDVHGLFHVSSGRISKFDLLHLLKREYRSDVEIDADDSVHCDRSLEGTRFEEATGYLCPPLEEQIKDLIADPTPYLTLED